MLSVSKFGILRRLLLLAPVGLYLIFFWAYPAVRCLVLSFTNFNVARSSFEFVGMDNYRSIVCSHEMFVPILRGVGLAAIATTLKCALGVAAAFLIDTGGRSARVWGGMLGLPLFLPASLIAILWLWLFYDVGGFVNILFQHFANTKTQIAWLGSKHLAFCVILSAIVWRGFPIFFFGALASIRGISQSVREATLVDGASRSRFWYFVGVPHIAPSLLALLLLSFVFDLGEFESIYLLTRGGPGSATHTATTLAYEIGMQGGRIGYALAILFFIVPVVFCIVILLGYMERRFMQ